MESTNQKDHSKKRRSFFSFRITTALILVVIAAIGVQYYKKIRTNSLEQYESAQWIKRHRGKLYYDFQIDAEGKPNGKEFPDHIPKFLLDQFGLDLYCNVIEVKLNRKLKSIEPIHGLKNLKKLELGHLETSDISPLKNFIYLEELKLRNLDISNLDAISNCKQLKMLSMRAVPVGDISVLSKLGKLEHLNLDSFRVTNLKPLANLKLKFLRVSGCNITDLNAIPRFDELEELDLAFLKVTDLSLIERWPNLKSLNLYGTQVSDLTPLKKHTKLQILKLSGTLVTDISPLKDLKNLIYVDLPSSVQDLRPIAGWTNVEYVDHPGGFFGELSILKNLVNLKEVRLGRHENMTYESFSKLKGLEALTVNNDKLDDLSVFEGMSNLKELKIGYTNVKDLSPISKMANLEVLRIYRFIGKDFTVLKGMKNLTELEIHSQNLDAKTIFQIAKALPDTKVFTDYSLIYEAEKIYGVGSCNKYGLSSGPGTSPFPIARPGIR